jgi:hypothetical protein
MLAVLAIAALLGGSPAFKGEITPVRWSELRHSYRAGCPVGPAGLRSVHVSYWDFRGRTREGTIVVARRVAPQVLRIFRFLWAAGFPIRRLRPVSAYGGSDERSMAADNTSGFNCRYVRGTTRWSMHAYGEAIDVNPVENPYVQGSRVSPPAGRAFLDRSRYRKGMATRESALVDAFLNAGWKWGASFGDYQHFSTTGR